MLDTTAIRKNLKIIIDGDPWIVVEHQFVKPGKGQAFTRTRLKNLITGSSMDRTFKSGEKIGEEAKTDDRKMVFLYSQGSNFTFMDNQSYEQIEISSDQIGDARNYLIENMEVEVLFYNALPINIDLPNFVELQIIETEPAVKGDTVSGATKPAELSTGLVLNVPLFVNPEEWILVDTRNSAYVERVKK